MISPALRTSLRSMCRGTSTIMSDAVRSIDGPTEGNNLSAVTLQRARISTTLPQSSSNLQSSEHPVTATGKLRNEVPLPSQEPKTGLMQYALYVIIAFGLIDIS